MSLTLSGRSWEIAVGNINEQVLNVVILYLVGVKQWNIPAISWLESATAETGIGDASQVTHFSYFNTGEAELFYHLAFH